MEQIVFILDKIGIFAFAFVGVSYGIRKKLDVFGLLVIGVTTAIGGGILRDVCRARTPYAITHIEYMLIAVLMSIAAIIFYHFELKIPVKLLLVADTIGLASFAVSGANVASQAHFNIFVVILFAILTGVGGGVMRDTLLNEVPFVLKKDVYATAAGIGGAVFFLLLAAGATYPTATIAAIIVVLVIRTVVIKKKYNLPVVR